MTEVTIDPSPHGSPDSHFWPIEGDTADEARLLGLPGVVQKSCPCFRVCPVHLGTWLVPANNVLHHHFQGRCLEADGPGGGDGEDTQHPSPFAPRGCGAAACLFTASVTASGGAENNPEPGGGDGDNANRPITSQTF